jgi:hypothetical protein
MLERRGDGSAVTERELPPVEIDRGEEPYRWLCPNGHISWDRTNNHLWCPSCRRALDADARLDAERAEHYHIVDAKGDREIPYDQVAFAGEL